METVKIKKLWAVTGEYLTYKYDIITYQINENGYSMYGLKAICPFCKKSIKDYSVAYDYKFHSQNGGKSFCAKSHLKNWLKINK